MVKFCKKCGEETDRRANGRCKPCHLKSQAAWYERNKDKANSAAEAWKKENKEKVIEIQRRWQEGNRELTRAKNAKWASQNADRYRAYNHNRRQKIRDTGSLSGNIKEVLNKKQKGKCACCGISLNGDYHLDHIVPLSLGGKNVDSNIQLLHSKCNLKKSNKHPVEFMQAMGFLL